MELSFKIFSNSLEIQILENPNFNKCTGGKISYELINVPVRLFRTLEYNTAGAQLVLVWRVRPHPLKFGNGCAAPILKMTKTELEGSFLGLKVIFHS